METIAGYESVVAGAWTRPPANDVPDLDPEVRYVLAEIERVEADIGCPDHYARRRAVESVGAALIDRARAMDYPLIERHQKFWPVWHGFVRRQVAIDVRREDIFRRHHAIAVSSDRTPDQAPLYTSVLEAEGVASMRDLLLMWKPPERDDEDGGTNDASIACTQFPLRDRLILALRTARARRPRRP